MSSRKWKKKGNTFNSFYETTNNKTKDIRKIQTNIPYDHR